MRKTTMATKLPSIPRRTRKSSLFELDRPLPTRTNDPGVSVMTHADFPVKVRVTRGRRLSPVDLPSKPKELQAKPGDFDIQQVKSIIRETLENGLDDKMYDSKDCGRLARQLVHILKHKVGELRLPGFKMICTCYITKHASPSPSIQSGCAWDESVSSIKRDKFAEYVYKSNDIMAVGTVFGVYCRTEKCTITSKFDV